MYSKESGKKCNLFTHGAPRSSKNSFKRGRAFPDRIGIWKCWFLWRGENQSTRRKTSRRRVENQQQTQPTYDAGSGNGTKDTLVGGERSHHCANPAPEIIFLGRVSESDFISNGILLSSSKQYSNKIASKIFVSRR